MTLRRLVLLIFIFFMLLAAGGFGADGAGNGRIANGGVEGTDAHLGSPNHAPSPFGNMARTESTKRVVGYYTSWSIYARKFKATAIPIEKLTHLIYAFAKIVDGNWTVAEGDSYADTEVFYPGQSWDDGAKRGNFDFINNQLRLRNPAVKTLIAIGGWTWYVFAVS
jgi:chitinase